MYVNFFQLLYQYSPQRMRRVVPWKPSMLACIQYTCSFDVANGGGTITFHVVIISTKTTPTYLAFKLVVWGEHRLPTVEYIH